MEAALVRFVRRRAAHRCEYCQLPQVVCQLPHEIDHIIAQKHRGATSSENLALACVACNNYKSCNIAGIDPMSGQVLRLFNPRRDRWKRHFRWDGPILAGRTAIGRTTIIVLEINLPERVLRRQALIQEGVFPPH
ncbi:MAG TPA: HNH endonuclease signature motif containing protein [Pirellulales bacterium]|jgi:hypothetical protein|nr:HNH endonuclease signature motif containing protein [Pirellulales bacterium]